MIVGYPQPESVDQNVLQHQDQTETHREQPSAHPFSHQIHNVQERSSQILNLTTTTAPKRRHKKSPN